MKVTKEMLAELRAAIKEHGECGFPGCWGRVLPLVQPLLDERKALREAVRCWRDAYGLTDDAGSVALALGGDE